MSTMVGIGGQKRPKFCQRSLWTPHEPQKYIPTLESVWNIGFLIVTQVVEEKPEVDLNGFKSQTSYICRDKKRAIRPKKWIFKVEIIKLLGTYLKKTLAGQLRSKY